MPRFRDPVMNSRSDYGKENEEVKTSALVGYGDLADEGKQRADVVVWLNGLVPHLSLPLGASDEELRACLDDGAVLCDILKRLNPRSIDKGGSFDSSKTHLERVKKFLAVMDEMGLPSFEVADLEQGPMTKVLKCLLTLRAQFNSNLVGDSVQTTSSILKSGTSRKNLKHPDEGVKGIDDSQVDPTSPARSSSLSSEEKRRCLSNFKRVMCSPVMPDPSAALGHHAGRKFHEVFQLKGRYADLPAANISEMMKSNSLDNAPTQSLLSVVNGILDESLDRKNGEIPHRVACLLRKVVQEIERRISTQAEQIRTQNNLYKAREEKYQSRIRVLETLATGTGDETQITVNRMQHLKRNLKKAWTNIWECDCARAFSEASCKWMPSKTEIAQREERNKVEEQDIARLMKEKEQDIARLMKEKEQEIAILVKEKEQDIARLLKERDEREERNKEENKAEEQDIARLMKEREERNKAEEQDIARLMKEKEQDIALLVKEKEQDIAILMKKKEQDIAILMKEKEEDIATLMKEKEQNISRLMKEKEQNDLEISALKKEVEISKKTYEQRCQYLEEQAKETQHELQERLKELQLLLEDSRKKEKELETFSALKAQNWHQKEQTYQSFINFQLGALQELRLASQYVKQDVVNTQKSYTEDFSHLGTKLKGLADVVENFNVVLAENRKLHNEVQDMKGNIRVYCRIRPSFSGQSGKKTTIDYIGENGELAVVNPAKPGKESHRSFKFNKVFGPSATQEEVFLDTQPLIRSVLDGYNVCIFAYGQTGSGKTYTMIGPTKLSKENWGVNYRALNDLFHISWKRRSTIMYEVGVQMVEIYNEQVRDLLSSDTSQKRLEIRSNTQASGLAVPDATMHPVKSTTDVMDLMQIGLTNRAMSSTAMNERSSRSHSIVTVHVRGTDLKTGAALRGSLHLVDLAGSERVDRSEVTGDRLKEAQHINKSLSSLGDVIFALAQKSAHVPYRNSKLTQVLQSSLGGQAKTLMFVQLNPDPDSFSESLSTLKFAERVSGVELGAARSSKEGKDVRELMEQVASLKDTIAKKEEEIEHLQLLNDPRTVNNEKQGVGSMRQGSSSPNINSLGGSLQNSNRPSGGKNSGLSDKAASDQDNCSEYSDRHSETGSHQSLDDLRHDPEERSSDASDGGHSMGIEIESSVRCTGDSGHYTEGSKQTHSTDRPEAPSRVSQTVQKYGQTTLARPSSSKDLLKVSRSLKKTVTAVSVVKPLKRPPGK